jgi:hypothetical protein
MEFTRFRGRLAIRVSNRVNSRQEIRKLSLPISASGTVREESG